MYFTSAVYGILFGLFVGLIWSFALNVTIVSGLIFGGAGGAIFSIVIALFGKAASERGNISKQESGFIAGSLLTMYSFITSIIGLLVWAIRSIFF